MLNCRLAVDVGTDFDLLNFVPFRVPYSRGHVLIFTIANIKESNKIKFESYSVRNSVLIISHITFSGLSLHIFFNSLSRNSCMQ